MDMNTLESIHSAQGAWAAAPIRRRLRVVRALRRDVAMRPDAIVGAIAVPGRVDARESWTELLNVADAAKFLERRAGAILARRRLGARGRPPWLGRTRAVVVRKPLGVVLIVAPGNYPLFLPAVQILQALVAGNAVILKPAPGTSAALAIFHERLIAAGLPDGLLAITDESTDAVHRAIDAGVDHVIVTGSVGAGRAIASACARRLIATTMELSGDDPVIVLDGADLDLAAKAIAFGRRLNGANTCIAPRRLIVAGTVADELLSKLDDGARALPSTRFADAGDAVAAANDSPFALGASIFGPVAEARWIASRLRAGCVTINDLIAPTADPRLCFGGAGESGFGVTRGAEGLLAMTRPVVVTVTPGRFRPHYDPPTPADAAMFRHYLFAAHGRGVGRRLGALFALMRTLVSRGKTP